jgi:uncharacterized membrane protein YdjX (TVP38/TMEM64 family)
MTVSSTQSTVTKKSAMLKLVILAGIIVAVVLTARALGLGRYTDPAVLVGAIRDSRSLPAAPLLFILAYAVVASFGLPGTPLTLAGGAIFGVVGGTLYNWIGASIGATGAYLLARALGKDAIRSLLGKRGEKLDSLTEAGGFMGLLRLRLIPAVPFNALNFGAGLAGMKARDYVAATALGILPGTAVYTYFADSLLAGAEGAKQQALVRVAIAGALLIMLSFIPTLARRLGWIAPTSGAALLLCLATSSGAQPVDHSTFDVLLKRHVVDGMVDYDAFKTSPEFAGYLASLDKVNPAVLPEKERIAFWVNVYNAFTIQLINKHNERQSIRNINKTGGVFKFYGPWREQLVKAGGKVYHLDNVEHDILRKEFKEPRIHFALVCAAMGCPPLRSEAYTGAALDEQLEDQGKIFMNNPTKNRVDVGANLFNWSLVFEKFGGDFGPDAKAVGRYAARYLPQGPERALLEKGGFKTRQLPYDWTLNSQEKARKLAMK